MKPGPLFRAAGALARLVVGLFALAAALRAAEAPAGSAAAEILHDLRRFAVTGSVLHVGAHPDDENTQLIAWLSRGRGVRTAYLSITRGDGGQNELGPEFDAKLGVIRTQELLAARRVDGGRQFSAAPSTSGSPRPRRRRWRSGTTSRCWPTSCA